MRISMVLAITSPTAFLEVNGTPSAVLALQRLRAIGPSLPISIAVSQGQSETLRDVLRDRNFKVEILICEPRDPRSFAEVLLPRSVDIDAILIHDASRPLVNQAQFEAVLAAFNDETDAVRPAMAFTETLKILNADSVIMKTLDRSTVHRISTPELIRVSAINITGSNCGWFLPLKENARTSHLAAGPEGLRINTSEDRDLMELSGD